MNILVVNPIMYSNETDNIKKVNSIKDTLMYNVCLALKNCGCNVTLVSSFDFKPIEDEDYPFKIIFFKSILKKICYPRIIPLLKGYKKYLKKNKNSFDFAICSESFSLSTFTTSRILKEKCIIWQEMAKHQRKFFKLPSKIWHNLVVRFFYKKNLMVPRSKEARDFICNYSKNICSSIIEHGVNLNKFTNSNVKVSKQFLVASQLIERKHIDKIIDQFYQLLKKYRDYKLVICGDGPLKEQLVGYCKSLDIQDSVLFRGNLSHDKLSVEYYKSLALLIYTSQDNNMVSIIESICSGTPVITTSIPYNCIYIKEFKLGIVNDYWGTNEMEEIINNYNFYSENCISYRSNLSTSETARKFVEILKKEGKKND